MRATEGAAALARNEGAVGFDMDALAGVLTLGGEVANVAPE